MSTTPDGNAAASTLTADDIRRVLEALDASGWDEALITVGDLRIAVARNGGSLPLEGTAPAAPAVPTAGPAGPSAPVAPVADTPSPIPASAPGAFTADVAGEVVTAPSVGVFWRAPEPGAAPFVEVGAHVARGDTLCIVEVMKLMSHVDAPVSGTVAHVHVENAQSVEHGAPLFTIVPDGS
ncbi:hypothetical protein KVF89_14180 [Nocardioides carbamazepini]|uniref:acetyl-CoA carboxylase biotin carboxyl carrier protein n=1 Tax=Nocardioides carbamazepini TaxID=2854259 RepID=UPI002149E21D|nr:biotin/lipoyl-containing protein [Nocardioides carbamazepini]MCR1783685.1 hypothetical protein [Nocardioides carbamazepini]